MIATELTHIFQIIDRHVNKKEVDTKVDEKTLAKIRQVCKEFAKMGFDLGTHGSVNVKIVDEP